VKSLIAEYAAEIRESIRQELKGRMVCLKVDSCSRDNRHFFAVLAQFISDASIQVRTLALEEVFSKQTSTFLKTTVENTLREFDLPITSVYTYTSDNGGNMLLAAKELADQQEEDAHQLLISSLAALTETEGSTYVSALPEGIHVKNETEGVVACKRSRHPPGRRGRRSAGGSARLAARRRRR